MKRQSASRSIRPSVRSFLFSRIGVLLIGVFFLACAVFLLLAKSDAWFGHDVLSEIRLATPAAAADGKVCPCGLDTMKQPPQHTSPEGDNRSNAEDIQQTRVVQPQQCGTMTEARAYRLILNGETCRLDGIDEIRGDFKQVRGLKWEPGMICCRLLDASGRQLAVETMPAPDRVCVVLDPHTPDGNGNHTPVKFNPGGEAVFQTRLPKMAGASTLQVIRLSGGEATSPERAAPGQIIATIELP